MLAIVRGLFWYLSRNAKRVFTPRYLVQFHRVGIFPGNEKTRLDKISQLLGRLYRRVASVSILFPVRVTDTGRGPSSTMIIRAKLWWKLLNSGHHKGVRQFDLPTR